MILKPASRRRASAISAARLSQKRCQCHAGAGLGHALGRRRSASSHSSRRTRQNSNLAQVRFAGAAEKLAAIRRVQCGHARQGAAPADVAWPDLRAGGPKRRLRRRCARLVCGRCAGRRYRAQFILLSPHPRRLDARGRRACAGLRRYSGRGRQHRAAGRGDRAFSRERLHGDARFSQGAARHRAEAWQGRVLPQAWPRVRRSVAGVIARRAQRARRYGSAVLCDRRGRRDRL